MAVTLDRIKPPGKHWTYEDLQGFRETEQFEIYDGRLIPMSPAPSYYHQRLVARLHFWIETFLQRHPVGEVAFAPLDVVLAPDNVCQPDLVFIANENKGIIKNAIAGAPDLAVEILSPSSIGRDRHEKLEQYARFGVKEYWIIDPADRSVEVLALRKGRYIMHRSVVEAGAVSSLILEGFAFDAAQLF